uniref:TSA: Wollemia nobilis Ref_Wollemi_Transcript_3650_1556 transcribed RNA sequence n=1 Tax=Wollemia nobilis TaxID=56998 RepID=A0A0C9SAG3_9CONI
MCQPHQLWIFPHFSRLLGNDAGGGGGEGESPRRLLQNAMVRQEISEEEYVELNRDVERYHSLSATVGPGGSNDRECHSLVAKRIAAPVGVVWSVVRQFDRPQAYKHFISSCSMRGDGSVGSTREVRVVSGLPAASSTERLEILDDERHIISFRVLGGDHRLHNYRSVTTLHDRPGGGAAGRSTVVIESYVVDVPEGNSREETRIFADTIVRCNLQSLALISERAARRLAGIRSAARP